MNHVDIGGKNVSGRGNSKYKGPEAKKPKARARAGWKRGWEFGGDLGDVRLRIPFRL